MRTSFIAALLALGACTSADDEAAFEEHLKVIGAELNETEEPGAEPVQKLEPIPPGISVKGGLSPQAVHEVVMKYDEDLRACRPADSNLVGTSELRWVVSEVGAVAKVSVRKSSASIVKVSECLREKIKGWKFPPPAEGEVEVIYPFSFR